MKKKTDFYAMISTTRVSFKRLPEIIRPGDTVTGGTSKITSTGRGWELVVTHVAWWGVYVVLNPKKLAEIKEKQPALYEQVKGHHKMKWCHLWSFQLL